MPLRLALGACLAASFCGCAFWVSPDEIRVEVRSVPEGIFQTEIVAEDPDGLARLSYAQAVFLSPFGASWGTFKPSSAERLPANPHTTQDYLRWRVAARYAVITLDCHRVWRAWWFEPEEVVLERSPETRDIETRVFDLQGRTASAPLPDETLRLLGIAFGLRKPSFGGERKPTVRSDDERRTLRRHWTDELKRDLESLKADISAPAKVAWQISGDAWHLVIAAEFAATMPDLWSAEERMALEEMYEAFYEFDDAMTLRDTLAQKAAVDRFEVAMTQLSK